MSIETVTVAIPDVASDAVTSISGVVSVVTSPSEGLKMETVGAVLSIVIVIADVVAEFVATSFAVADMV